MSGAGHLPIDSGVAHRLQLFTILAIMCETSSNVRVCVVTKIGRRAALLLSYLALVGGCTTPNGSVGDNVLSGISEGISSLAAHLVEAFFLNLLI